MTEPLDPVAAGDAGHLASREDRDGRASAPSWRQRLTSRRRGPTTTALLLGAIVACGFYLRTVGIDWDAGHHLHPDERFLTDVASSLAMPNDLLHYLDTDTSPLNPRNQGKAFFSYGTWPITIARVMADAAGPLGLGMTDFGSVYIVGRYMSGVLDLLTVLFVFGLGAVLYDRRVGLLAALFTAFTAFHIQQSHFFTVDAALTCFVMWTLFGLALAVRRRTWWPLALAGAGLGMALGSKVTVWLLVPIAVLTIVAAELRQSRAETADADTDARPPHPMGRAAAKVALLGVVSYAALRFAQPDMWAGPGWPNVVGNSARFTEVTAGNWHPPKLWFDLQAALPDALEKYLLPDPRWMDSMARIKGQVTGFGMDWPPNHQWWGRKGYLFPWRNMVLWGMGPALGLAAWGAWLAAGVAIWRGRRRHLLPWLWVSVYFGYTGIQWAKTMRYALPIYPALAVLAAWGLVAWLDAARRAPADGAPDPAPVPDRSRRWAAFVFDRRVAVAATAVVALGTVVWGTMFSRLYTRHHSRIAGSHWIYHNLPTAVGVRIADDPAGLYPGPWLPALAPGDLRTVDGVRWPLDAAFTGPMRLHLPDESWQQHLTGGSFGARPDLWTPRRGDATDVASLPRLTVDAVRLAYAQADAASSRTVRVVLSQGAALRPGGAPERAIAQGRAEVRVGPGEAALEVPLDAPLSLHLGQEVYVWVAVDGGPITCRPARMAYETSWDDIVPEGMYGYAGYDDATTDWVDGLFGVTNLEMYGEDYPDWLDQTLDQLSRVDYWVSSSNRVYGAVAQLPMRYPATIAFYENVLFGETLGWRHRASVQSFPSLGPLRVNDQGAEEAFHVYDHPQVDVFERPTPFDAEALRAYLAPITATRRWSFPPVSPNPIVRFADALFGRIPVDRAAPAGATVDGGAARTRTVDAVLLDPARLAEQRAGGTWRDRFDVDGVLNRYPVLGVVAWYLVLALLGLAAFPLVAVALPRLPDRGWSLARTAGLLATSYGAWLAASTGVARHGRGLLVVAAVGVALLSTAVARWAGFEVRAWLREHRGRVATIEAVFLALFVVFLAIRMGNPDLWHISKGGEKPMDFAYLNATLRSVRFPPYDPWFAGSKLNYYYFGFVFVGALIQLTGIVPWVAYNLAIPTLAALTGTGVCGVVIGLADRLAVRAAVGRAAGVIAAGMTVLMGNLYQAPWLAARLAEAAPPIGHAGLRSAMLRVEAVPILGQFVQMLRGAYAFATDPGARNLFPLDWWYWNASRAIPSVSGDVQPITEFPFFTFLYADLHAHMMAMPIAVLACGLALGWATPGRPASFRQPWVAPEPVVRLSLGALAIGALWPTNTWDYPTYGLVAAGAIAIGAYARSRRFDVLWFGRVAATGGALLALSLALFLPYHRAYVTPYSEFQAWHGFRTPASAYLTVHGIFLCAIASWAALALADHLARRAERDALAWRLALALGVAVVAAVVAWQWSLRSFQADLPPDVPRPELATPLLVAVLMAVGLVLALHGAARPAERLLGWLLFVGALLTGFVEYVVLSGDIGRMNTVFKFYIHVWILWSIAGGAALAALLDRAGGGESGRPSLPRSGAAALAAAATLVLVSSGMLYTVTAARAKILDRFPADRSIGDERAAALRRPGLSGIDYMAHAAYVEYGADDQPAVLDLRADLEGIRWLLESVDGTPTILEGTWPINYHWGSRFSIYTGLPTVIGWDWHQKQQKAAIVDDPVGNRLNDVRTIYETTDDALANHLLDRYGVELVIVGQLERMRYDAAGLAKFERWAEQGAVEAVFANDQLTIYRRPLPESPAALPDAARSPAGARGGPGRAVRPA